MIGSRCQPSAADAVGSFLDYLNERIYIGGGTTVAYTALGGSPLGILGRTVQIGALAELRL